MIPAACDLNMTSSEKGWLNAIIFVGMMIGGYVFGGAADIKVKNRYIYFFFSKDIHVNGIDFLILRFPDIES